MTNSADWVFWVHGSSLWGCFLARAADLTNPAWLQSMCKMRASRVSSSLLQPPTDWNPDRFEFRLRKNNRNSARPHWI